jgi:hypothetical protein
MKKAFSLIAFCGILFSLLIVACNKESDSTRIKVRLTDNPYNAEEVNVDIREVRIKFRDGNDDDNNWQTLETEQGIYNLLGLQNGLDTLIAEGVLPTNHVKEIRLILGDENSIKIDDVVYEMNVPSGAETGLKIKVNKSLSGPVDSILVDFDAGLSVHQTGTGLYQLKPVLKIK